MMNALIQVARNASPYLAVGLLLPGGPIIALLLWLFRHRFKNGAAGLDTLEGAHEALASLRGFGFMRFRGWIWARQLEGR
jgi:hypothetical protein